MTTFHYTQGTLVQDSQMKEPENYDKWISEYSDQIKICQEYQDHLASLKSYKWIGAEPERKDGLREGIEFELKDDLEKAYENYMSKINALYCPTAGFFYEDFIRLDFWPKYVTGDKVAIPIQSVKEERDINIQNLYSEMGEFAKAIFPESGSVEHLIKLKQETDEAIKEPVKMEEYADCLLCLFGAMYKAGFNFNDIISVAKDKLELNKTRKWEKKSDGTYQHQ